MTPAIPSRARWRCVRSPWRLYLVVLAGLLAVRAALPLAVEAWVERVLARADGYGCEVGDVDLNLWRGAYEIERLRLRKLQGASDEPFVDVPHMDLSVRWASLARGELVGEVVLRRPVLQAVLAEDEESSQTGAGELWQTRVAELFPVRIDRFVVLDGELRLRSITTDPEVDLFLEDFYLEASNLTNVRDDAEPLPAHVEAAGRALGSGEVEVLLRLDPLASPPRFDLDAELRELPVQALNDFLRAYGGVDAERGTLWLSTELATAEGSVEGYVKTVIEGLEIFSTDEIDDAGDALEAVWEGFVSLAAEVLQNQPHDRLATKVPLRGELGDVSTDVPSLVASLLRNAFVAALRPAVDESIDLGDLEIVRAAPEDGP